jgi:lambda family phage portal protein
MGIRSSILGWLQQGTPAPIPRRRMYEGARVSRLTSDWVTSGTSADAEIKGSLPRLRNRSRQLVRDNDYARQAIRAVRNNVIGTGIRMQAQVRMQRGGGRLDQTVNDAIELAWADWGRKSTCHTAGRLSFQDIERLLIGAVAESGEVFVRMVRQPFGGSKVPFALEIIESDLLDDNYTGPSTIEGNEWRMGVELNRWGRPVQYAFLTKHPGDSSFGPGTTARHRLVPAAEVLHLYVIERPGQTRGVPWLASAIQRLHMLSGYEQAEVVRARASSSLMGFITSPEGELLGDEVLDGERVSNFEPGVFKYLAPGESVTVPQLDAPDGQLEPFLRAMLRAMAAGVGCSYETISRDFSQTNYSSSRLSLLEDRENWKALQHFMIENFHKPVFEAWLEMAVLGGALNLPAYETDPDRYRRVRWMPRGWAWVDPAKEVQAYKDAVRCGFKTQADVVAEQGGDLEELLLARAAELQMADELDLMFDTDPHEVNGSGTEQPSDPAEDQAEEMNPASDPDEADDNVEDNVDAESTDGPIA